MFTFIETKLFTRLADDHLGQDGLMALQAHLLAQPESGAVIPGSGGIRKLRWAGSSRGKRGGLRVIYFVRTRDAEIWLLTLYAKNEAANISKVDLRKIKECVGG